MPTTSNINGTALASISNINGTAKASVDDVSGTWLIPPSVSISGFTLTDLPGTPTGRVQWTSVTEVHVDFFLITKRVSGGGAFENISGQGANGAGSSYSYDDLTDPATYDYRVYAVYLDGSTSANPIAGGSGTLVIV